MLKLLQIVLLLIIGNLLNSTQSVIVEHHAESVGSIVSAEQKQNQPGDLGCFKSAEPQSAIVNNQRNNVRTFTTRSFRTTSSNGTTKGRFSGGAFINTYNNLLTSKRWKETLRIESAPFHFSCPCDYYVIALRHIIR